MRQTIFGFKWQISIGIFLFLCLSGFTSTHTPPIIGLWHLMKMKTGDKTVEVGRYNPNMSLQFLGNATMIRRNSETDWEFFTYTYQEKDSTISVLESDLQMKMLRYTSDSLFLRVKDAKQTVTLVYAKHKY